VGAFAALAMSEKTPPDPLARLGEQIEQARKERLPKEALGPGGGAASGPLGLALRIAVEMVAALGVGVGLGLGFDYLVGTRPWGLVVGVFVGGAAGILNVLRAAQELGRSHPPQSARDGQRRG
jgi:ATP synthase protein I